MTLKPRAGDEPALSVFGQLRVTSRRVSSVLVLNARDRHALSRHARTQDRSLARDFQHKINTRIGR
jgi:hypothetical protein